MAAHGRFITFEGGDGVGKSTQAVHLAHALEQQGINTVRTFEPGGTPFGEKVRELFLGDTGSTLDARTQALLLNAARRDHLNKIIYPALERGEWVICDRFSDSTLAYQGIVEGAGLDWAIQLDHLVAEGSKPDLTILLTLDPETTADRLSARENAQDTRGQQAVDRYDRHCADARKQIEVAFRDVAGLDPARFVTFDGGANEALLAKRIWQELEARFDPLTEPTGV